MVVILAVLINLTNNLTKNMAIMGRQANTLSLLAVEVIVLQGKVL